MKKEGPTLQATEPVAREGQPSQAEKTGAACHGAEHVALQAELAQARERGHAAQSFQPV